ncbi:transposase [Paenibacillus thalictri]|uniref:Mutator family transposase n=1 Tax=Paenibacillus thalictri TaxID=2527873 RepID=A0A4Q9DWS2_9BACL|nr:transposase [Paenibacillus thalictri]TBL80856.1 hypothetical protein EYB31_06465 [Paenibacillus thalictri]
MSYKDVKQIASDLKPLYKAPTEEAVQLETERFKETWRDKYQLIVKLWRHNWDKLTPSFKYPPELR